jgi:hypothetical protein
MIEQASKTLDTEGERQQRVDQMVADHGPDWSRPYEPGSFGCHELLDRTALVAGLLEQYVRSHPACIQYPDWFTLADQAATALAELYQRIGAAHLSIQDDGVAPEG